MELKWVVVTASLLDDDARSVEWRKRVLRLLRQRKDVDPRGGFLIDYRAVNQTSTQNDAPVHRCTCHFTGRVQGVGFRYTAQNLSLQYDVAGYVRNLSDGRVEMVVEGRDCEMDCFLDSLKQKMNGYIKGLDRHVDPPTGEFRHFSIRH